LSGKEISKAKVPSNGSSAVIKVPKFTGDISFRIDKVVGS
jgi:hypothetical protein